MSARSRRGRGFTLVELLVALAISMIIVVGALGLLQSQQRTFRSSAADRAIQENARLAFDDVTSNLRLAGYGLEPAEAFDFGPLANLVLDRLPPGQPGAVTGYACGAAVTCRDSIAGPDEVVFHSRDPGFMRPLAAVPAGSNPASITMQGPLNQPLHRGQILQVACFSGAMYWSFVTVGSEVPANRAAITVTVPLLPGAAGVFGLQNAVLSDTCFQSVAPPGSPQATVNAAAKVFLVNRYRYYVATYDGTGNVVQWGTPGARPFLMLDPGLLDANGNPILQMVAPDVEDFQVAYVFPRSNVAPMVGATQGTALSAVAAGIDMAPAVAPPLFSDPANSPSRATNFPANIGAVRLSIVLRSGDSDPSITDPAIVPAAGNRPDVAGPAGYRRSRFDVTAATPNLDIRAPFFPSYSTSAGDRLNVGGG